MRKRAMEKNKRKQGRSKKGEEWGEAGRETKRV
jgi:hypothetical protein